MAPLIDVVFQLLIFFMLSSSFNLPQLKLALPSLSGSPQPTGPTPLVVSIDENGAVFVNQENVERATYKARLLEYVNDIKAESKTKNPVITVNIRMDRNRPYHEFLNFVRESKDAGATTVGMIYESDDTREN